MGFTVHRSSFIVPHYLSFHKEPDFYPAIAKRAAKKAGSTEESVLPALKGAAYCRGLMGSGIGGMSYRRFLAFSVVGAVSWITSMILIGYTLHLWLEPILEKLFGRKIEVARNIDKLIFVVAFISILPILIKGYKSWRVQNVKATTNLSNLTNEIQKS